jgi:hypothetical protein
MINICSKPVVLLLQCSVSCATRDSKYNFKKQNKIGKNMKLYKMTAAHILCYVDQKRGTFDKNGTE